MYCDWCADFIESDEPMEFDGHYFCSDSCCSAYAKRTGTGPVGRGAMTDDELRAIRERWAKATPGPWEAWQHADTREHHIAQSVDPFDTVASNVYDETTAAAIAAAPTDIATLLAEVERLQAALRDPEWLATQMRGAVDVYAAAEHERVLRDNPILRESI